TGEERAGFAADPLGVRALAFAPDGKTLASAGRGGREVRLWDVSARQEVAALPGTRSGVLGLRFAPGGRLLATGGRDGGVALWDLGAGDPGGGWRAAATLHAHEGAVWGLAFSPDGHPLATAGEDWLVRLWSLGARP